MHELKTNSGGILPMSAYNAVMLHESLLLLYIACILISSDSCRYLATRPEVLLHILKVGIIAINCFKEAVNIFIIFFTLMMLQSIFVQHLAIDQPSPIIYCYQ